MSTETCTICNKKLSDKRSLRRHKQTVHKQYKENNSFVCHACGFERSGVIEMENHMREKHLSFRPRYCLYCNKLFVGDSSYVQHMNKVHGLPIWNSDAKIDTSGEIFATEKAFGGVLKIYDISVDNNDIDLLSFMRGKQNEIDNVIRLNTQTQPQKVQFCAIVELTKPVDEETPQAAVEHITIFTNSKAQRVEFPGLNNECFSEMTEQMIIALNNFSSHGSGWSINQIKKVEMRLTKTKQIRASSK